MRARGVVQPLIVRPDPSEEGAYQIVAGERRYRAARMAGLQEVPVVVRDYGEQDVMEIAIIENVQRADLDAIEEGRAYKALIERFGHTQEQVAGALDPSAGYDRSSAAPGAARAGPWVPPGRRAPDAERIARDAPAKARRDPRARERDEHVCAIESMVGQSLGLPVRIDMKREGSGHLSVHFKDMAELDDLLGALTAPRSKPEGR